ncbi:hypothetical protein A2U01_0077826, partial [Trifolium medium]|nr:hypothetical protein [Trifolium medium]
HLQGELPQSSQSKPVFDDPTVSTVEILTVPTCEKTSKIYDRIYASLEDLTHPDIDYVIRTPDPEDDNPEQDNTEVESSPEAIEVDIPASEKTT